MWPGPDLWLHGDVHPGNLLVDRGRLSAVVDDTWTRARGWALALGVVTMANSGDNPA